MKKNGNIYTAEDGCFIVRKADDFVMGENIDLGTEDSIDNYTDVPYTEEQYEAFYAQLEETRSSRKGRKTSLTEDDSAES